MQDVMQTSQPQKQQYPTTTTSSYEATKIQQPTNYGISVSLPKHPQKTSHLQQSIIQQQSPILSPLPMQLYSPQFLPHSTRHYIEDSFHPSQVWISKVSQNTHQPLKQQSKDILTQPKRIRKAQKMQHQQPSIPSSKNYWKMHSHQPLLMENEPTWYLQLSTKSEELSIPISQVTFPYHPGQETLHSHCLLLRHKRHPRGPHPKSQSRNNF
jgi:hypothetical protein